MADIQTNQAKLYKALQKVGFKDLGNEQQFAAKLQDSNNRQKLYNALEKRGFKDLGDYNSFEKRIYGGAPTPSMIDPQAQAQTQKPTPTESPQPQQPQQGGYTPTWQEQWAAGITTNSAEDTAMNAALPVDKQQANRQTYQQQVNKQAAELGRQGRVVEDNGGYITEKGEKYNVLVDANLAQRDAEATYMAGLEQQMRSLFDRRDELQKELDKVSNKWVDADGRVHSSGSGEKYDSLVAEFQDNEKQIRDLASNERMMARREAQGQQKLDDIDQQLQKLGIRRNEAEKEVSFFDKLSDVVSNITHPLSALGLMPSQKEILEHAGYRGKELQEIAQEENVLGQRRDLTQESMDLLNELRKEQQGGIGNLGLVTAGRNVLHNITDRNLWDSGVHELERNFTIAQAIMKQDNGQELTANEKALLNDWAYNTAVNSEYYDQLSGWAKAGMVTRESLPFMLEMALNPLSGLGESTTKALTKYAVERYGAKWVRNHIKSVTASKLLARGAADIAGAYGMSTTTGAARTAADAIRRMTGEVQIDQDDRGDIIYNGVKMDTKENPLMAIFHGLNNTAVENWSEMAGNYLGFLNSFFGKMVGKSVIGKAGRDMLAATGSVEGVSLNKAQKFIYELAAGKGIGAFSEGLAQFSKKTQWHGIGNEYLEEVIGNIANVPLVGDMTFDTADKTGVFNLQQNIDTFCGVALMGGFMSALHTAGFTAHKINYNPDVVSNDNAKLFGDELWGDIKTMIDNSYTDPRELNNALTYILRGDSGKQYSPEEKKAVLKYTQAVLEKEGREMAEYKPNMASSTIQEVTGEGGKKQWQVTSLDVNGDVITQQTFDTEEDAKAFGGELKMEQLMKDYDDYLSMSTKLSFGEVTNAIDEFLGTMGISQDSENYEEALADINNPNSELGRQFQKFKYDKVIEKAKASQAAIAQFEVDNGWAPGTVKWLAEQDPMQLDQEGWEMQDQARDFLESLAYPTNEVHVEHEQKVGSEAGQQVVEQVVSTEEPINPQNNIGKDIQDQWDAAQAARQAAFDADENLKIEVERMEDLDLSPQEIISSLTTFRPEQRQAMVDYYNAQAKYESMVNAAANKINEEAAKSRQRHTFKGTINGTADLNNVYQIIDGTNTYTLVSGKVTTDPATGKITDSASGLIIGLDENGNFVQLGDSEGYSVVQTGQTLDQFEEAERERLQQDTTTVIMPNGPKVQQQETQPGAVGGEAGGTNATGANEPPTPEPVTEEQHPVQIPIDEKTGVKMYEQGVPVDEAIKDMEADGLDVNEESDLAINEAQAELGKIKQPKTRAERVKNAQRVKELQNIIDYYNGVKQRYAELHPQYADAAPFISQMNSATSKKKADEILNAALQAGVNPEEINSIHTQRVSDIITKEEERRKAEEEITVKDQQLSRQYKDTPDGRAYLLDRKRVPNAEKRRKIAALVYGDLFDNDFEAWRDLRELISSWLSKGRALDPDSFGQELGWDMSVGKDAAKVSTMFTAKKENGGDGVLFNDFVHTVSESSGGRFDTQEVRNELLEMFRSAQEKSDLTEYQLMSRIQEAEARLREEDQRAAEAAEQGEELVENQPEDTGSLPFPPPIEPSEQLKPTDLTDAINPDSPKIGAKLAKLKAQLQAKIKSWLTDENIEWAEGKDLDEVIKKFGNDPEPIAVMPEIVRKNIPTLDTDYLYCGKAYLIDHHANHHPELDIEEYDNIQEILDSYDDIKDLSEGGNLKIAFVKKLDKGYAVVAELSKENDKIVLHKTFFYKDAAGKRVPYKNKPSILEKWSVDGSTTISPVEEQQPADTENISALDQSSEGKDSEKSDTNQENEQKSLSREDYLTSHPLTEEQIMADAEALEDEKLAAIDYLKGEDESGISQFYYDQIYQRSKQQKPEQKQEEKNPANPVEAIEQAANEFKRDQQKAQDQKDIDDALKEFNDFLDNAKGNSILDKFMHKGLEDNDKAEINLITLLTGTNAAQQAFMKDLLRLGTKVGYAYIKSGIHDFQAWSKKMSETIGQKLKDVLNWEDSLIGEFLDELWNQKYTVDGERLRLSEHAEKLKNNKGADTTVNVNKQEDNEPENDVSLQGDSAEFADRQEKINALSEEIARLLRQAVLQGEIKLKTMQSVKALAKEYGLDDMSMTDLQELVEAEVVSFARDIAHSDAFNDEQKFENIKHLYEFQPSLNARDNDRIDKQQYSTPAPMAYLMGLFVDPNHTAQSGLEPSAGNGMLTIALPKEIMHVNDIDEMRLSNLQKQGFGQVTSQDGTQPFSQKAYDVVVTNPPFGTTIPTIYDGIYEISGLEHQMAINALESMRDDGRAAIIIGGNTEYKTNGAVQGKDRVFLNYLYSHYNVVDVINMDGKTLYSRQGTGYPVRMILINGRKQFDPNTFAPVKSKARAEQVKTYEELYKRVNDDILSDSNKTAGVHNTESGESNGNHDSRHGEGVAQTGVRNVQSRGSVQQHSVLDTDGSGVQRSDTAANEGADTQGHTEVGGGLHDVGSRTETSQSKGSEASSAEPGERGGRLASGGMDSQRQNGEPDVSDGVGQRGAGASQPVQQQEQQRGLSTEKVPYKKQSSNPFTLDSLMPAEQADEVKKILEELGDVDQFLVDELGYANKEELHKALAAEQIDSVAMAIHQMNQGNAFIIGDMTGIGKGRQAASLIRYGVKKGGNPVFITVKKALFSDMYRDLCDIGSPGLRPFIWCAKDDENSQDITDADGNVVYKWNKKEQERVVAYINEHGKLPPEYDYVVTTYDGFKSGTKDYEDGKKTDRKFGKNQKPGTSHFNGQAKRDALEALAENSYVIMDESHNAGGDKSNVSKYLQYITVRTKGTTFLSATFAKRPENMPIYALRTAISKAGVKVQELIDAVKRGGATFQEVMSKALTGAGQMIRRERNMEGVTIDWKGIDDESVVQQQREQYDKIIGLFNDIINFQRSYVDPIVNGMNDAAAEEQGEVDHTPGTRDMGINNTPFASRTYNIVQQVLLSLKAQETAKRAIEHLKEGRKPVIAVANTNEKASEEAAGSLEEDMEMPDLSVNLKKGLQGTMRITKTDANGNETKEEIPFDKLSEEGKARYREIMDAIENASTGLSLSPIDVIKNELKKAGYKVGELTGRKAEFVYNEDGTVKRVKRQDKDKKRTAADFNNGTIDALVINRSAGTGISLHASTKYKDQRQRIMLVAQAQGDVNDEVQMRGRIDRTGQVLRGMYEYVVSQIPSEQRLLMMLKAKLRSLDANTTSSQKSKFNEMQVQDIINKYGDEIVIQYLAENPELAAKMVDPLKWGEGFETLPAETLIANASKEGEEGKTASKVLGRMALLTVKEQEKMLKEIGDLYQAEIDRLNEMGENDLEITEMPLKAKTLSKAVWETGVEPGGKNPFADNSYVEEVEMDILKKPMKAEEVKRTQERLLGGKTWDEYKQEQLDKVDKWAEDKKAETTETFTARAKKKAEAEQEKYVKGAKKAQEKNQMTDAEIERNGKMQYDTFYKQEMEKLKGALEAIDRQKQAFVDAFDTFSTDGVYALPKDIYDLSQLTFEPSFGKVIDIKVTDNFSTNASTITFATLDGRRKITIPINGLVKQNNGEKRDIKPSIVQQTAQSKSGFFGSNIANMIKVLEQNVDNWDKLTSTATRKKGYIITGNLLKALTSLRSQGKGGKLISYTTDTGEIRQGVLMSDNFDPSGLTSKSPISSAKDKLNWAGDKIVSADKEVTVKKNGWGPWYELKVPKSNKRGAKYFNDEVLLSLMEGQFSGSTQMTGDFKQENLDAVLKRLDQLGVTVTEEHKEDNNSKNSLRHQDKDVGLADKNVPLSKRSTKTKNGYEGLEDELQRIESTLVSGNPSVSNSIPGVRGNNVQTQGGTNFQQQNADRRRAAAIRAELEERKRNRKEFSKKYGIDAKGNISIENLAKMFRDLNTNKVIGKLFEKVLDVLKELNVDFRFTDNMEADTNGEAVTYANVTFYDWDAITGSRDNQQKARIILHEMIHNVASHILHKYDNPILREFVMTPKQRMLAKTLNDIFEQLKKVNPKRPNGNDFRGMNDVHEMLSEIANPEFRDALENIQVDVDTRSVWQRIKDAFKKFFGGDVDIKKESKDALSELDEALDDILDNYTAFNRAAYRLPRRVMNAMQRISNGKKSLVDSLEEEYDPITAIKKAAKSFRQSNKDREEGVKEIGEYSAKQVYHDRIDRAETVTTEAFQDDMISLKVGQDAIAHDKDIPDSQNAYQAANLAFGRMYNQQEQFTNIYRNPTEETVLQVCQKMGWQTGDVDRYLFTKHGFERNRGLFVRDWLQSERWKEDADQSELDDIENGYNETMQDNYEKLMNGDITFPQYLEALDEYIRENIDSGFDANKHDYSGFTEMFGSDFKEEDILADLVKQEEEMGKELYDQLWKQINLCSQYGLDKYRESGMISEATYKRVSNMFHFYVPMRGFKEGNAAEDHWQYMTAKDGANTVGGLLKTAKGRKSEAGFPLATLFAMTYKAISDGEQNMVKQKFYRLCQANPNDLVLISDTWAVMDESTGDWTLATPDINEDMSPQLVEQKTIEFFNRMRKLQAEGKARKIKGNAKFDYKVDKDHKREHIVEVKINGDIKTMVVAGNPRMALAINGKLHYQRGEGKWNAIIGNIKQFQQTVSTSYNITFAGRNMARDWTHFGAILAVREGKDYELAAQGYYWSQMPHMVSLFNKYRKGTLDMSNEMERDFKDFMDNGGITGFVQMQKVEELQKEIQKLLTSEGKVKKISNGFWDKTLGAVQAMNEAIENNARFATYRASRHVAGRTKARSAYDAKEVTVNFNKKGAGKKSSGFKSDKKAVKRAAILSGETAQILMANKMFFNATVQAICNIFKGVRNKDGSINMKFVEKLVALYALPPFAMGLMMPVINQLLLELAGGGDGDDDPYANLPEWVRRKNLCVYVGWIPGCGKNDFLVLPMGQELAAFYSLGDMMAGYTYRKNLKPIDKNFTDEIIGFLNVFSPVDFETKITSEFNPVAEVVGRVVSPVAPLVALGENVGWTGRPIFRQDRYPGDEWTPEYQMTLGNTNSAYVSLSKWLNDLSGGDDVHRGWAQINPSAMQYAFEQYAGGPGKFFMNTGSALSDAYKVVFTDEDPDFNIRKVEFIRAFFQQGDERTELYRTQAKYRKYREEANEFSHDFKGYEKDALSNPDHYLKYSEMAKSKERVRMEMIKEAEKRLKPLNTAANQATGRERKNLRAIYNNQLQWIVNELDKVQDIE